MAAAPICVKLFGHRTFSASERSVPGVPAVDFAMAEAGRAAETNSYQWPRAPIK
jgi:hypothetical protein